MEKKQPTDFSTSIFRTKLFRDDLEELIEKIKSRNFDIKLSDKDNYYDSIEDIIQHKGNNPNEIIINGRIKDSFDRCYIRITNFSTYISIDAKTELLSLGYELKEFFKARKRKWYNSYFNALNAKWNIAFNIVVAIVFWFYYYFFSNLKVEISNFKIFIYLILAWLIIWLYSELNPMTNSKIELERKHQTHLYEKNKEKIIIGIIMAIVGSLITLLIKNAV